MTDGTDEDLGATGAGAGAGPGAEERPRRSTPVRRQGPRPTPEGAREIQAQLTRPSDEDHTRPHPMEAGLEHETAELLDEVAQRRAERMVGSLFLVSALGTVMFCVGFALLHTHGSDQGEASNMVLGSGLALALGGIGAGMVLWAKKLLPHSKGVQDREPFHSQEEEELLTEELFLKGVSETGIARRKFIRRSMATALGLLPLAMLFPLRDLGPLPEKKLRQTLWRRGVRLVDMDTRQPVRLGDIPIGGQLTVMPEGFPSPNEAALSPVMLIRLPPGVNHPAPGRSSWAAYDHVAYSKICTHAGCPVSLYEQQTHHLLCPCHQSTFDLPRACKVIFGPAARPLPQLPIYVDSDGYFRAQRGFDQPVGPSFWERG